MAGAAAWPSNSYEALIGAVGTASLGDVILHAAENVAGVDEVFGFWIEGDGSPMPLASSGHRGSSHKRASLYSTGFHSLDPLLPLIRNLGEQTSVVSASLTAGEILDPVYRRECFDRPGLSEKIAFVRTCGTRHYVLSFYRSRESLPGITDRLNALAEFTLPILKRHGELIGDEVGLSLTQRLEHRLARAYPALTRREREVCARSLTGMTAEATALDLGIAETSVLTYRRRAYERYSISSAGQLLEYLLG
ncbi:regulatory protein LuxR [Sphingobium chlorophenolicum L-1]|uniref:Regulatory protein LuxR n=1 Tax=Sphingobium chlorophenolicum L-1 TaxID=690566 RepID=F6EWY1_SPHCR|nr:LuxR C-terminal-related transcriptional regulator [Sphingobium chlorophenolicum]AEG48144.1 regulatory protein LuxR [Sphingobium chlorophenolicum L-1]